MGAAAPLMAYFVDATAVATMAGSFLNWLPPVAAGLTILWLGWRIYRSVTCSRLLGG